MTRGEMLATIEEIGIVPAVRASSLADALFACEAIFHSSIPVVEITMTTPGAVELISQLRRDHPDAVVGAGTVLELETAEAARDAGASFLTSTGVDQTVIQFAREHDIPMIPGALTPSEVMLAVKAGAPFIKLFPCSSVGGPSYIRSLRGPFPDVRLIASGGVTQQTAADYVRAGANVLGIGRDLLPPEAIRTRNSDWIHELARRFIDMVRQARRNKPGNSNHHNHAPVRPNA